MNFFVIIWLHAYFISNKYLIFPGHFCNKERIANDPLGISVLAAYVPLLTNINMRTNITTITKIWLHSWRHIRKSWHLRISTFSLCLIFLLIFRHFFHILKQKLYIFTVFDIKFECFLRHSHWLISNVYPSYILFLNQQNQKCTTSFICGQRVNGCDSQHFC